MPKVKILVDYGASEGYKVGDVVDMTDPTMLIQEGKVEPVVEEAPVVEPIVAETPAVELPVEEAQIVEAEIIEPVVVAEPVVEPQPVEQKPLVSMSLG
jgi:hypothetical protein